MLQAILSRVVDKTFNQISVDADTSTNDCVVCIASGAASKSSSSDSPLATIENLDSPGAAAFEAALCAACTSLAKGIAWDGEGAHVLVQVCMFTAGA